MYLHFLWPLSFLVIYSSLSEFLQGAGGCSGRLCTESYYSVGVWDGWMNCLCAVILAALIDGCGTWAGALVHMISPLFVLLYLCLSVLYYGGMSYTKCKARSVNFDFSFNAWALVHVANFCSLLLGLPGGNLPFLSGFCGSSGCGSLDVFSVSFFPLETQNLTFGGQFIAYEGIGLFSMD